MNSRGADVFEVPLARNGEKWFIEPESLRPFFSHTHVIVYVNMPHNPTGSAYTSEDWENLLNWAKRYSVILVVDEAYTDIRYNDKTVSILTIPGWERKAIVLQSVSKGWNATGLRFGWVIGHPTIIKAVRKVMDVKDSGLFGPSIAMGIECLCHPEWAEETRKAYQKLHIELSRALSDAGFKCAFPDAGLCQFTPAPVAIDGTKFSSATECAIYMRKKLRISIMHYTVKDQPFLRWAVTIKPVPKCGLETQEKVIEEMGRRLSALKIEF